MADRIPLIVNPTASQIQELPTNDRLLIHAGAANGLQFTPDPGGGTGDVVTLPNNITSSNKTSGALVVTGGVGIGGALNVGGDITAFSSSDVTLKENITPIQNAVDKVLSISGNTFRWNEKSVYNGEEGTGIIAQEIEALELPGVTETRQDGTKAVRYDRLVPLLIEAIKELDGKIKSLGG